MYTCDSWVTEWSSEMWKVVSEGKFNFDNSESFYSLTGYTVTFRTFIRRFCPKRLTVIHTYIHTLIHTRSSLGFSILPKDTSTCRPGNRTLIHSHHLCYLMFQLLYSDITWHLCFTWYDLQWSFLRNTTIFYLSIIWHQRLHFCNSLTELVLPGVFKQTSFNSFIKQQKYEDPQQVAASVSSTDVFHSNNCRLSRILNSFISLFTFCLFLHIKKPF